MIIVHSEDEIKSILGINGGTCSNLGNGLFICACRAGFTGSDCSISHCVKESCFNGGTCSIENNSHQCQCPCGFTGKDLLFCFSKSNSSLA